MRISSRLLFTVAVSALLALAIACASVPASPGDSPLIGTSPTPSQSTEPAFVETLAPIDNVEVRVAESFPVQYFLLVTSGLSNGCARFDGYEVTRDGEDVRVRVTNLMPADPNVACTANYRTVETNIALGTDFDPGITYNVAVNDFTTTFTTESAAAAGRTDETVSEPAPIESVRIEVITGPSPQSELIVVSGLPNGCYSEESHRFTRDGDTFRVEITNSKPADPNVACTDNYRTVETWFPLAGDIEPCKVYTVDVNGESRRVQAIGPAVRCEEPTETPSSADTIEVLAPIEGVKVRVAESFPPQYFLQIGSAQPNGCAKFNDIEVTRDGDTIRVKVTNLIPADPNVICTQVYSVIGNSVALGSDFEPGIKYTVIVNDVTETFVAQGTSESPPQPTLGSRFEVALGQAVTIGPDGLQIQFLEVTEDSRCPTDVVCVQAGQAVILVGISGGGQPPSLHELTLEGGREDQTGQQIGDYLIEFLDLEPHPKATGQIDMASYVATLVVSGVTAEDDDY